jgi:hypothetical protein
VKQICKIDQSGVCAVCGRRSPWPQADRMCVGGGGLATEASTNRHLGGANGGNSHSDGPGTELKKLLATVGITASPTCSCNARAAEMNARGVDWCKANIDTIVGWLREEAAKRGLPFLDAAGRLLVRRAIRNARKAAS